MESKPLPTLLNTYSISTRFALSLSASWLAGSYPRLIGCHPHLTTAHLQTSLILVYPPFWLVEYMLLLPEYQVCWLNTLVFAAFCSQLLVRHFLHTPIFLVGGLVAIFYFPIYWECHHPNWLSYFSEGWPNHQPIFGLYVYTMILSGNLPDDLLENPPLRVRHDFPSKMFVRWVRKFPSQPLLVTTQGVGIRSIHHPIILSLSLYFIEVYIYIYR